MNLEEAKANIGAEVELDKSTKPYNFIYDDGNEYKRSGETDDSKPYKIIGVDTLGNAILEINGYQISPRHLKLKPQNYKIHVPTEAESEEAQRLFFELGYEWEVIGKNFMHVEHPYLYSFSNNTLGFDKYYGRKNFEIQENKQITLQELRDMVAKKKGIKSIGVDLASGEDKTMQVTGTIHNFEPRKEMTWQDAFKALIDGKEVEMLDIYNDWENINDYSVDTIKKSHAFRLALQRITLNGEYTKEELLQKIGDME